MKTISGNRAAVTSDLDSAPSAFENSAGQRIVFIDISDAHYDITFDTARQSALAKSEIRFVSPESGFPVVDLLPDPISVAIDGAATSLVRQFSPDNVTRFRRLGSEVAAGEHVLTIEHEIPGGAQTTGEGVRWYRRPRRVSCMFSMTDLNWDGQTPEAGGFLERYLPSNLEYDHFAIKFSVRVLQSSHAHRLITNIDPTAVDEGAWEVELPSYYTSSCPWFHLIAERDVRVENAVFDSVDGRQIPVLVYTIARQGWQNMLTRFLAETRRALRELESRHGPFPHAQVTVYAINPQSGMEYAGATRTGFGPLEHELNHSYFARHIVPSNGDSGWIDEAIASWGDRGNFSSPNPPRATANMGNRSPYRRTTHRNAYSQGRDLIAYLDHRCQDVGGMTAILREYRNLKSRQSVSTADFQQIVEDKAGASFQEEFDTFVFGRNGGVPVASQFADDDGHPHRLDNADLACELFPEDGEADTSDSLTSKGHTMLQRSSDFQCSILGEISDWLDKKVTSAELAHHLHVPRRWVDELELATQQFRAGGAAAPHEITLEVPTTGDVVDADDKVAVILDHVEINSLFTDNERLEREDQEGTIAFNVNGQATTLAWQRELTSRFPKEWASFVDDQKRLLFVGEPRELLDLDVILVESDEAERDFFQRISDLLRAAATFAGFVPGAGTPIAAAFSLGAAVAQLIKAKLQDDAELRYLGSVGGSRAPLRFGKYELRRHTQGETEAEVVAEFRVEKFAPNVPKSVMILLDELEFRDANNGSIIDLEREDRLLVDVTVTGAPTNPTDEPRVASVQIDRPYFGENQANWPDTMGIQNKLLYDGDWGLNVAVNINMSGVPRDINEEEWMKVLQQTGALAASLAKPNDMDSVRRGFEIAEAVRATVVKFLPKLRFASSLSTLLFVGNAISGLYKLERNTDWQDVAIPLQLGTYGEAVFKLKVKLGF